MEKIFYYFGLISFGFCCQIIFCFLVKKYKEENKKKASVIPNFITTLNKLTENLNLLEIKLKEYKKHIPEYKKGILLNGKPILFETDFEKGIFCSKSQEDWSKQLNEHLRSKGFKNDEPFGMAPIEDKEPKCNHSSLRFTIKTGLTTCTVCNEVIKLKTPTAPPLGFNHDFHKQAIEAEKELDNVCKPKKECEHFRRKIDNWYPHSLTAVPSVTTIVCLDCGKDLTIDKKQEMKNRQIEIGKEIEKLRIEARTIKNQLKDSK